jgi:hypothetical protein
MEFRARARWVAAVACGAALALGADPHHGDTPVMVTPALSGPPAPNSPDASCATCHRAIYKHYEATPMARASGGAMDGLMERSFIHEASVVHYRIFKRDGAGWLS